MLPLAPWIALGSIVAIAASGLYGYNIGVSSEQKRAKAAAFDKEVIEDKALRAAAAAISDLTVVQKTIHQKLEREVREKTVYRDTDCSLDADGVRLINAQLEGRDESSDSGELPKTDKVTGWFLRGRDPEAVGSVEPVQPVPEGSTGGE